MYISSIYYGYITDILALFAIISAIRVITSSGPVIAVMNLVAVFVFIACYLVIIGIVFIGLSYLIVYVGAVAVLFLFVIMMLNVADPRSSITATTYKSDNHIIKYVLNKSQKEQLSNTSIILANTLPLAILIGIIFFYTIYRIVPNIDISLPISFLVWFDYLIDIISISSYNTISDLNSFVISSISSIDDNGLIAFITTSADVSISILTQVQTLGISIYTHGSI